MRHFPVGGDAPGATLPPACPECHAALKADLVCWQCCDRLCQACGRPTGSAFIEVCWFCELQACRDREAAKAASTN